MRLSRSEWAATLVWTAVAGGAAALLTVLWVRGGLRCEPRGVPCIWAGSRVWGRAAAAALAGALAGRAFVPFVRGYLRYLRRPPGRVPAALGLCVAALPVAALAATYDRYRPSRWTADFWLAPYERPRYEYWLPDGAPKPSEVAEVQIAGPGGITGLRVGASGVVQYEEQRVPLRVGDRIDVTVRLLAPGRGVLVTTRAYPLTVAPEAAYTAQLFVGWRSRGDITRAGWDAYPVAGSASDTLFVRVGGANRDIVF